MAYTHDRAPSLDENPRPRLQEVALEVLALAGVPHDSAEALTARVIASEVELDERRLVRRALATAVLWRGEGLDSLRKHMRGELMNAVARDWAFLRQAVRASGVRQAWDCDDVCQLVFLKFESGSLSRKPAKIAAVLSDPRRLRRYLRLTARSVAADTFPDRLKEQPLDDFLTHEDGGPSSPPLPDCCTDRLTPLAALLEKEREESARNFLEPASRRVRELLARLSGKAGKKLVTRLVAIGRERGFCSDELDTLRWIRSYVFSDYPRSYGIKRAAISDELLRREAADLGLNPDDPPVRKRLRAALDLNNRRLNKSLRDEIESEFGARATGRRKTYTHHQTQRRRARRNTAAASSQ